LEPIGTENDVSGKKRQIWSVISYIRWYSEMIMINILSREVAENKGMELNAIC
jgi:hypothetical protein